MAETHSREAIAADYQAAREASDMAAMRRFQNEEACLVLLAILERLAVEPASFIHHVALKGGILMAGELRSPRSSADIDATTGRQRRIDPERVIADLRRAGRAFNVRLDGEPDRTQGGLIVHFRFDSLTDAGTAKLEVSVREDLVFAVRDALFDVSELGLARSRPSSGPGTRRWGRGWIRHGYRRPRTRSRTSPVTCASFASTERLQLNPLVTWSTERVG